MPLPIVNHYALSSETMYTEGKNPISTLKSTRVRLRRSVRFRE